MGLLHNLLGRSRRVTEPSVTRELPREPGELTVEVGNIQGVGRRERQEDSFAVVNAASPDLRRSQGLLAVVADGMGGMADGKEASQSAVEDLLARFRDCGPDTDIPAWLAESVHAVSREVFRRRFGKFRQVKIRIVAKASRAARLINDFAGPACLRHHRIRIIGRAHRHKHAGIGRTLVGDPLERSYKLGIIGSIVGMRARVACRMHAWLRNQRMRRNARIVGHCRKSRSFGSVTRFGQGIFQKSTVWLFAGGDAKRAL